MKRVMLAAAAVVVLCLGWSSEAQAGGVIIYHSGEDFFESGPMPPPFDQDDEMKGAKAGYGCDIFGLFWAYFTISNCRPAYEMAGQHYWAEGDVATAIKAKYPESSMKVGFWTKHGRWVLGGVLVIIIIGGVIKKAKGGSSDD